jgi:hypothetical protein
MGIIVSRRSLTQQIALKRVMLVSAAEIYSEFIMEESAYPNNYAKKLNYAGLIYNASNRKE